MTFAIRTLMQASIHRVMLAAIHAQTATEARLSVVRNTPYLPYIVFLHVCALRAVLSVLQGIETAARALSTFGRVRVPSATVASLCMYFQALPSDTLQGIAAGQVFVRCCDALASLPVASEASSEQTVSDKLLAELRSQITTALRTVFAAPAVSTAPTDSVAYLAALSLHMRLFPPSSTSADVPWPLTDAASWQVVMPSVLASAGAGGKERGSATKRLKGVTEELSEVCATSILLRSAGCVHSSAQMNPAILRLPTGTTCFGQFCWDVRQTMLPCMGYLVSVGVGACTPQVLQTHAQRSSHSPSLTPPSVEWVAQYIAAVNITVPGPLDEDFESVEVPVQVSFHEPTAICSQSCLLVYGA